METRNTDLEQGNTAPTGQGSRVSEYPPEYDEIPDSHTTVNIGWNKPGFDHSGPGRIIPQVSSAAIANTIDNEDASSTKNLIRKRRRRWADFNSHERSLYIVIGVLSAVALAFMLGCVFLGLGNGDEEFILPEKVKPTTELPPWLTYAPSTTPRTTTVRTTTRHPAWNTCVEPACIRAGVRMQDLMSKDPSSSPCKDFYEYACGGWSESSPMPDINSAWDQFYVSEDELTKSIRNLLEVAIDADKDSDPVIWAKQVYETCKQGVGNNLEELKKLIDELTNGSGGKGLAGVLAKLRVTLGANFMFKTSVDLDEMDTEGNKTLYIDQPDFGLHRIYLIADVVDDRGLAAYKDLIQDSWTLVYGEGEAEAVAEMIVDLEIQLANITTAVEERRNKSALYEPMLVDELYDLDIVPKDDLIRIRWENFFEPILQATAEEGEIPSVDVDELTVVVRDLSYFSQLNSLLASVDEGLIKNYLKWRVILSLINDVSPDLEDIFFTYRQKTEDVYLPTHKKYRWKTCAEKTTSLLGAAVAHAYFKENDFQKEIDEANSILTEVRQAFLNQLPTLEWISDATKARILEKIGNLTVQMAYPEFLVADPTNNDTYSIVDYYDSLTLSLPENHLRNVLEINEWGSIAGLRSFNSKKDATTWTRDVLQVNAWYSGPNNALSFPAGILRLPFFMYPVGYMNYATFGTIIGHELVHGYDDLGRQYGPDGNLGEWWDEGSLNNFTDLAECFVDQYNQYKVPELGINLNGRNTLAENIADSGGVNLALKAYIDWGDKLLPGFDGIGGGTVFTNEQLFFIAFAQNFCSASTDLQYERTVHVDTHSPNPFRVKGVIDNSPQFASAFGCEVTKSSCSLW